MPKVQEIKKVLVIGSGPIVIGQAAEFDYSGTQACLTLKDAGINVVLLNNNPATIMTDEHVANTVYFEPLTVENIEKIIKIEKPDGILATVSGQTGLNLIFTLDEKNILQKYNVKPLGTPISAIAEGEDRELFRNMMERLDEPIAENTIVSTLDEALQFKQKVQLPIIVRPAYTLGGSGGGIATNEEEFVTFVSRGLRASPIGQCLIERSIAGWKEIEFEVVRDRKNNAVIVCHMENIDPVGIHTGDSIVVAPIQTLSEDDINKLRTAALKIVRELGIVGACNVQLAFEPETKDYIVIEVNPRVSRSSALASKATGYPIAKIATKLSLGKTLDELEFPYKRETLATYEPQLDYVVVKFPSWPFNKLKEADRVLGTQMKATGEVMAIDKHLAGGIQKAIRSLDVEIDGLQLTEFFSWDNKQLEKLVRKPDDRRFFALLELMRRNYTIDALHEQTKIDKYFLMIFHQLISLENKVKETYTVHTIRKEQLLELKQYGFTNEWLASAWNCHVADIQQLLIKYDLYINYNKVIAYTNRKDDVATYYYTTWGKEKPETREKVKNKVLIIGSGPIQIGQGIEFDYCSVQGVQALQKQQYETVLVNNNPATVSTDYELADRLIIEPITAEDVLNIMELEGIEQVIVQFGGQTSLNLVQQLEEAGVEFFGTTQDIIDQLEDRDRFYRYLQSIDVPHIPGLIANNETELLEKVETLGYPVLIRPSYVIGGRGMEIFYNEQQLHYFIEQNITSSSYPLLIDAYYPGKEVEVDVVTDGKQIFIPAIFEHIEKAGVHSGDSMAITPPISLSEDMKKKVVTYAERIAKGIQFKGIFNIQYVLYEDQLYVLEVNPRASRTVPVISKITGVNMIELATRTLLGESLQSLCGDQAILPENNFYAIKAPVFSTTKLPGVDPKLVPEMKSTGELIALGTTFSETLTKAFLWNERLQQQFAEREKDLLVLSDESLDERIVKLFKQLQIQIVEQDEKVELKDVEEWLKQARAFALYQLDSVGERDIRERALEFNLFVFTSLETVEAFANMTEEKLSVHSLEQFQLANEKEVILQ